MSSNDILQLFEIKVNRMCMIEFHMCQEKFMHSFFIDHCSRDRYS